MAGFNVDILMATYNGERYICEQIESILHQTYCDWRLLVSDDCSSDHTLELLKQYEKGDSRITVVSQDVRHGGAKENFMFLLSLCDAPYVMFSDQDDVWRKCKIEKSILRIREAEQDFDSHIPLLTFSDMAVVDQGLSPIAPSFMKQGHINPRKTSFVNLLPQNVAAGCTILMNKALVELARRVNDDSRIVMHDWWMMLVGAAFGRVMYIDEPLSLYRQHGDNEIGANHYSPISRVRDQDFMYQQFSMSIEQARLFAQTYHDLMPSRKLKSLDAFIDAGDAKNYISGLWHLAESGCWKQGMRKLGQLAMIAQAVHRNRREASKHDVM